MSPSAWPSEKPTTPDGSNHSQEYDDAEKGLSPYTSTQTLPVSPLPPAHLHLNTALSAETLSPSSASPIHEGITPFSTTPLISLSWPPGCKALPLAADIPPEAKTDKKPAAKPKPKVSRWILANLWFNTYRKFFTFVTLLNLVGIILAAVGRFPYAENHLGALVLGNLLCAVLMRNELFLRFLYIISIYGLRSVSRISQAMSGVPFANDGIVTSTVGSHQHQAWRYLDPTACRRYPFRVRALGRWVCDCRSIASSLGAVKVWGA